MSFNLRLQRSGVHWSSGVIISFQGTLLTWLLWPVVKSEKPRDEVPNWGRNVVWFCCSSLSKDNCFFSPFKTKKIFIQQRYYDSALPGNIYIGIGKELKCYWKRIEMLSSKKKFKIHTQPRILVNCHLKFCQTVNTDLLNAQNLKYPRNQRISIILTLVLFI